MSPAPRHLLVVGASGVIGAAAVEHFGRMPGWRVSALSRRRPVVDEGCTFDHVAVDLADRDDCARCVAALPPITHMIYAAVRETPGLVQGWQDVELIAANGRMFANILDPVAASGSLQHLSLVQGAKAYGGHVGPVVVPMREDGPRHPHANFYWLHEDHANARAREAGFAVTIFRPQVLLGSAPGAAMNPVAAIGAYAALCRELGRPFAYPGAGNGFMEMVDAGLLAEAFVWAVEAAAAAHQTVNVTNGDVMVLAHAWPALAGWLALAADGEPPPTLAGFFAEEASQVAWSRLAERHGLRIRSLDALLGQSHHYLDLLLGQRIAAKAVPVVMSTIKIRQLGFGACRDSLTSLRHWLGRMADLKLLPPLHDDWR